MKGRINSRKYRRKYQVKRFTRSNYRTRGSTKLTIFISLAVVIFVVCVVYLVLPPLLLSKYGIVFVPPYVKEQTPTPTITPTPTPNPYENIDFSELQQEVAVAASQYSWYGDPYFYGDTLMFTAGELVSGSARMTTLFKYDTQTNRAQRQNVMLKHDHFLYPVFNDEFVVYLDAKHDGGGEIIAHRFDDNYQKPILIKTVYTGQPALFLEGNYLVWIERTGTNMDKLFICDLKTQETVAVQMFERGSYYGTSKPYIKNGLVIWADADEEKATGAITSQICVMNIQSGDMTSYKPQTYVHDPKTNGNGIFAWLDGNHGPDTKLYIMKNGDEPQVIAEGAVDFFMDDDFITYQKHESIFAYLISTGETVELTKKTQYAHLAGASSGYVAWFDVTRRDVDILKYAKIPK